MIIHLRIHVYMIYDLSLPNHSGLYCKGDKCSTDDQVEQDQE